MRRPRTSLLDQIEVVWCMNVNGSSLLDLFIARESGTRTVFGNETSNEEKEIALHAFS